MKILLIEDNTTIIKGLKYSLEKNNYKMDYTTCVESSIDYLNNNKIDLIILDITLPDGDGFSLYENYIKVKGIPTVILTALDSEDYIVKGLKLGAEDYITKPFSTKELLVRIERILLRTKNKNIITIKDITFDMDKMIVYKNKTIINLSSLELKLLNLLFLNLNKVVTRNTILDYILDWTGNYVDDHTVTVYFNRIKKKIGTNIITTVKGIGYRIDEK